MIQKETLLHVKRDVESYIGQEIYIKANVGRNRHVQKLGVIESTFTNLFVVKEQETSHKSAYTYADVLTNSLELTQVLTGESIVTCVADSSPKYTRL